MKEQNYDSDSVFSKLMKKMPLIDFFLDNSFMEYSKEELLECINYPGIEKDLEDLIHFEIIDYVDGMYNYSRSDVALVLKDFDDLISDVAFRDIEESG
jgi:hypothetical protein